MQKKHSVYNSGRFATSSLSLSHSLTLLSVTVDNLPVCNNNTHELK